LILRELVLDVINDADNVESLKELEGVDGLSGAKLVCLLQRLAGVAATLDENSTYLEVGVYQGLTLASVAATRQLESFGIDNFSQFDLDGKNKATVLQRADRHSLGNLHLIDEDFETALLNMERFIGERKVGLYFVDGPHDYRSQYLCLDFARSILADNCLIVIDDCNYEHVRRANADWLLANPEYTLVFEAYTDKHPKNMTASELVAAKKGWWNGVNVLVRDADNEFARRAPVTDKSVERFINDHWIHSSKYAEYAPRLLRAMSISYVVGAAVMFKACFSGGKFKKREKSLNMHFDD